MFISRHKDWGPLKTYHVMMGCRQTGVTVWVGGGGVLLLRGRILGVNMVNSYIWSFHWKCVFIRLKNLMYWFSGHKVPNIVKICKGE